MTLLLALTVLGAVRNDVPQASATANTTAVYWTNNSSNTLSVTNSASAGILLSASTNPSLSNPRPLATDGTHLFIGNNGGNAVLRTDMNGANATTLTDLNLLNIGSFYANATHLYYTQWNDGVWRANKDGSGRVQLVEKNNNGAPSNTFAAVFATADTVYFTYYAGSGALTGKVYKRSINAHGGTGDVELVYNSDKAWLDGIWLAGDHLYVASNDGIMKVGVDGANPTKLGNGNYRYITVVDGWIYYTKWAEVGRMRLDGTDVETVASGSGMYGIATAPVFTVTYLAPGVASGTVPVDGSSTYTTAATVTVLGNTGNLSRPGCTLTGWNTRSDGMGTAYAAGATFAMGTADAGLHAQWSCEFAAVYQATDATSGAPPTDASSPYTTSGSAVTVLGNTGSLLRTGHQFLGWSLDHAGSIIDVAAGATFSITAPATLSALWVGGPLEFSTTERGPTASAFAFPASTVGTPVDLDIWVRNTGAANVTLGALASQSLRVGDTTCPTAGGTVPPYDPGAETSGACRLVYRWNPSDVTPLSLAEHLPYGVTNSVTITGQALAAARVPAFDTPVATSDGFTVNVTNWDGAWTWSASVSAGSVTVGAAAGAMAPVTVSGLTPAATATLTVATLRNGFAEGSATVAAAALPAPTPPSTNTSSPLLPITTTPASTTPTAPTPATTTRPPDGAPVQAVMPGTASITVGGTTTTADVVSTIDADGNAGLIVTHGSMTLIVNGEGSSVAPATDIMTLRADTALSVRATGFPPNTVGDVRVFSTPRLVGRFTTDASGSFSGRFSLPLDLEAGRHTLVVSAADVSVALPLQVLESPGEGMLPATGRSLTLWWVLGLVWCVAGMLVLTRQRTLSSPR